MCAKRARPTHTDHLGCVMVRYNAPVEPLKRPFADWVDDRVIPAVRGFLMDHPLMMAMSAGMWWMGLRGMIRGEWEWLIGLGIMHAIFLVYLAIGWDARRQQREIRRKRAEHICLHCGYDMRANPRQCSECGHFAEERVEGEAPEEEGGVVSRFADFLMAHPVFGLFILGQIAAAPILLRQGVAFFFCFFGFFDLIMVAWLAADWSIERRQEQNQVLRQQQICIHCGYDLRATPDRCPECGRGVNES